MNTLICHWTWCCTKQVANLMDGLSHRVNKSPSLCNEVLLEPYWLQTPHCLSNIWCLCFFLTKKLSKIPLGLWCSFPMTQVFLQRNAGLYILWDKPLFSTSYSSVVITRLHQGLALWEFWLTTLLCSIWSVFTHWDEDIKLLFCLFQLTG